MIETQHPKLSVRRQCELVGINRNRLAPRETKATREDHAIMKILDQLYTQWPFLGARKLRLELIAHGWNIGRKNGAPSHENHGYRSPRSQALAEHSKQEP